MPPISRTAASLFDRFSQTATLGEGSVRKPVKEPLDTEMHVALADSFWSLQSLDGSPDDRDDKVDSIRIDTSKALLACLKPEFETLEFTKDLLSERQYRESLASLEQERDQAFEQVGTTHIEVQDLSDGETLTRVESDQSVDILYSSPGGKAYFNLVPEGAGYKAFAAVLPVAGQAYTETLHLQETQN